MRTETISDKSKFAIVESYKAARSNIMFSLSADDDKLFAVTSYSKGEGKSTVSANLAISFSKMEKRVLLVDCDLRRPNIHNVFKVENKAGLSNIIGKMVDYEDVVHRNVLPNLDILPSGTIPPNPSELLCSSRFTDLIKRLYEEYDYIIFDTPPIGALDHSRRHPEHPRQYEACRREDLGLYKGRLHHRQKTRPQELLLLSVLLILIDNFKKMQQTHQAFAN